MSGSKSPVASVEPRLGGIKVQTSLLGVTVPRCFGRVRIPPNLIWYDGFQAIPQEEYSETGKGGSAPPSRTFYIYRADVLLALHDGMVNQVRRVWKGKQVFAGVADTSAYRTVSESHTIPSGAPYTVAVDLSADYIADVRVTAVIVPAGAPELAYTAPLSIGLQYTATGGTYTFDIGSFPELAGADVTIDYQIIETAAAQTVLEQMGMTLHGGSPAQPVWSHLTTNYPDAALAYPSLSMLRAIQYPLTSAAEIENHNIEIDAELQASATNPDCRPIDIIESVLFHPWSGIAFPRRFWSDPQSFRDYCDGIGLYFSAAYMEQRPARDVLAELLEATNTEAAWTGATLRLVPRGDEDVGSYTAPTTPVFHFTRDEMLGAGNRPMVRVERAAESEVKNVVAVEYENRANDYAIESVMHRDEASEVATGTRVDETATYHFIKSAAIARSVAMLKAQRANAGRSVYEFSLPDAYVELEPGDLVQITDEAAGVVAEVAMIERIDEANDELRIRARQFPIAHASAPAIAAEIGSGFYPNWNADPGDVVDPVFFEPPGSLVTTGLEVWVGVTGSSALWGGCDVYVSLDGGASYKQVATIDQPCRIGAVADATLAAGGTSVSVQLAGRGGTLRSVSTEEADALTTLCYIGDAATGEFVAFESATLTAANKYTLAGLRRNAYDSGDTAHAVGAPFVYVDAAVGTSGPLDQDMIGQTVRFKFRSYNVFGGGVQALESIREYAYTITGRFVGASAITSYPNMMRNTDYSNGMAGWTFDPNGADAGYVSLSLVSAGAGTAVPFLQLDHAKASAGETATPIVYRDDFVQVPAGGRVFVAAELFSLYCTGGVEVIFYNADQSVHSYTYCDGTSPARTTGSDILKAESYTRIGGFFDMPSGADSVRIAPYKSAGTAPVGVASTLAVRHAQVSIVDAGISEWPPWFPGATGKLITDAIEDGAVMDIKRSSFAGNYPAATAILNASAAVGPFASDVEVVISGSAGYHIAPAAALSWGEAQIAVNRASVGVAEHSVMGYTGRVKTTDAATDDSTITRYALTLAAGDTCSIWMTMQIQNPATGTQSYIHDASLLVEINKAVGA